MPLIDNEGKKICLTLITTEREEEGKRRRERMRDWVTKRKEGGERGDKERVRMGEKKRRKKEG